MRGCSCSSAITKVTARPVSCVFLPSQSKFEDADALFVRVLGDLDANVGKEHPDYASVLNNRAGLLGIQVGAIRFFQQFLTAAIVDY